MILRIFKYLLILGILGALALVVYAFAGPVFFPADFAAPSQERTVPVTLELN